MGRKTPTDANWYYGPQPTAFSRLPENVQGLIAESITGKRGTLEQKNVQLAEELSRTRAGVGDRLQKKMKEMQAL